MSEKYPGGLITKTPVTPAGPYQTGAASGVWTREQQLQYQQQGIWPTAGLLPNYIEDVFSTYLYTGTGATQTITNNINLSANGGLVWLKNRNDYYNNILVDTARGVNQALLSNSTAAQTTYGTTVNNFNSNGFTLGTNDNANGSSFTYVGWTFRKQPKFFDIVTATADGSGNATFNHSLASTPGCVFFKNTGASENWYVYHTSLGTSKYLILNSTSAQLNSPNWITVSSTSVTSTGLLAGNNYVAYLFASNAGGFGAAGTDNVITCGSFTTDGSGKATINLGYEPQWVMWKRSDGTSAWRILDTMRGFYAQPSISSVDLEANSSTAEYAFGADQSPNATGFSVEPTIASATYIYIAIRRGPMKTPTDATTVFLPQTRTGNNTVATLVTGPSWPLDMLWISRRTGGGIGVGGFADVDRLRGAGYNNPNSALLLPSSTDPEYTGAAAQGFNGASGDQYKYILPSGAGANGLVNASGVTYIDYMFQRSPGFFDEVCYTGNGTTGKTVTHNLGIAPELLIVKGRSAILAGYDWYVYTSPTGNANTLYLDLTSGSTSTGAWNSTTPTSTTFSLDNTSPVNRNGSDYVAYLFATCAGVSKVGSYTGTGTLTTINCGFTGGARFVMIKKTSGASDWFVWDTARGMVSGTDPSLSLNTTSAESNANSVYTATTGFQLLASPSADVNTNGGSYIFLAIA